MYLSFVVFIFRSGERIENADLLVAHLHIKMMDGFFGCVQTDYNKMVEIARVNPTEAILFLLSGEIRLISLTISAMTL